MMPTAVIVITFSNGPVGRMQYYAEDTSVEAIQKEIDKSAFASTVTGWRLGKLEEFPSDAAYRNAWIDGSKVEVDMSKARELHRTHLRELRQPLLAQLDVEYQKADESGDQNRKTAIAKRKQALRDITADPAIDAAQTPEELTAVEAELVISRNLVS